MLILSIDITTAHDILLHINQVEFYNTCNIAIHLILIITHLSGQFQKHTRGQSYLIMTGPEISVFIRRIGIFLPIVIADTGFLYDVFIIGIFNIFLTVISKLHVAGQITQIVHDIVDTEIVTMLFIISSSITCCSVLQVE